MKNNLFKRVTSVALAAAVAFTAITFTPATAKAADADYYYGTATLSFNDFYAGDTSVSSYDVVSTATVGKQGMFANQDVEITYDTDGTTVKSYIGKGVKNVNVRVAAADWDALSADQQAATGITLNKDSKTATSYYKTYDVKTKKYSATSLDNAKVITDATVSIDTNSVWGAAKTKMYGNYEISIKENSTAYLKNVKKAEDGVTFDVSNDTIQGAIVVTKSGKKYGMRFNMETWTVTNEIAWSSGYVNPTTGKTETMFDSLEGETISEVIYITTKGVYDYKFATGAYATPHAKTSMNVVFNDDDTLTVTGISALASQKDVKAQISYSAGKHEEVYVLGTEEAGVPVTVNAVGQVTLDLGTTTAEDGTVTANKFEQDKTYEITLTCGKYAATVTEAAYSADSVSANVGSTAVKSAKSTAKKTVKVTWKKATGAAKYQVKYVTGKTTKTVNVKSTSKTIKGLKSGKTYKISVRAIGANGTSSNWSKVKTVKVK